MDTPLLRTRGISLRDVDFADVEITPGQGLTLLSTGRESQSSSYAMVIAGRMRPGTGTLELNGELAAPRRLSAAVALAGVTEIDTLERLVTVRTVVREQLAWASPWYRAVPRSIDRHAPWVDITTRLGLELDPRTLIGDLSVSERFRLRVALALLARPAADLLVVDDPDQVRSLELRAEILHHLNTVAQTLPVVVISTNPDLDGIAQRSQLITGEAVAWH